jgi:hypothetical protein
MNSQAIEGLLVLGKTAAIIGGGCAVTLGSIWAVCAIAINFFQQKDLRDNLLPLYEQGGVGTKPTMLNAHRLVAHELDGTTTTSLDA